MPNIIMGLTEASGGEWVSSFLTAHQPAPPSNVQRIKRERSRMAQQKQSIDELLIIFGQFFCPSPVRWEEEMTDGHVRHFEIWGHPICDQLHQNESHVANAVFELADDKRQRGDIYHFWVKTTMQQYEQ